MKRAIFSRMRRDFAPRLLLAFGLGLAALAAGCTGGEEPGPGDPPTIALLSPEGIVRVRENLAVAGRATGAICVSASCLMRLATTPC